MSIHTDMHLEPEETGVSTRKTVTTRDKKLKNVNELNKGLPDHLDYKLVMGYSNTRVIDVIVFDKEVFEATGSEYEAEVFRVTICNIAGTTKVQVTDEDIQSEVKMEVF